MDIVSVLSLADELYTDRARPDAVKESITMLASLSGGASRYGAQWRLARALFFLGQQASARGTKRQLHAAAVGVGERAVALNSNRVEGHFWLGVNLALLAEASGGVKAAHSILRARSELRRAAAISEAYHDAGPLRVLGRLEHKAPWFLGGSRKRSREYFDRALAIAPANSVTMYYAAELARDCGQRQRAIDMLEELASLPVNQAWQFENERDRELARSMLKQLRKA